MAEDRDLVKPEDAERGQQPHGIEGILAMPARVAAGGRGARAPADRRADGTGTIAQRRANGLRQRAHQRAWP